MTRQVSILFTGGELLLKEDDEVLAKRQDGKWVSLVPGLVVTVTEDVDDCTITLERAGWIARRLSEILSRSLDPVSSNG
jgi:hypothetical protein